MIKQQFRSNQNLVDIEAIDEARFQAIQGMSNYMIHTIKNDHLDDYKPKNVFTGEEIEKH